MIGPSPDCRSPRGLTGPAGSAGRRTAGPATRTAVADPLPARSAVGPVAVRTALAPPSCAALDSVRLADCRLPIAVAVLAPPVGPDSARPAADRRLTAGLRSVLPV